MIFLYNFAIKLYNFAIYIAHFFNPKARMWVEGRKGLFEKISSDVKTERKHIWFHFASLGEFEQGRPVLEKMKERYPQYPIIMTFFSPSGYELRKNSPLADHVFYLPVDTRQNAERFIDLINPAIVVFTKYEYWYHYFHELNQRSIPLYIISGIFRNEQPFFKWYGKLHRQILRFVSHFFVQDQQSVQLLNGIGIMNATVSGDTRFDRVAENAAAPKQFEVVKSFCGSSNIMVAGSTWPDDERLLAALIKSYPDWKFIVAPHEIKPEKIQAFEAMLPDNTVLRYSSATKNSDPHHYSAYRVLIIDNIGMLSSLYQYGQIAYIGGGFGVGIHNTLEAAAFGIPVIFGPNYHKFLEAKGLIKAGGGFSIRNETELKGIMEKLQNSAAREAAGTAAGSFVRTQKGATETIISFIDKSGKL